MSPLIAATSAPFVVTSPSALHPHEPVGFTICYTNPMNGALPPTSLQPQFGCDGLWFSNNSTLITFQGGKFCEKYPVGFEVGSTPGTLHARAGNASTPTEFSEFYCHLVRYRPGLAVGETATPFSAVIGDGQYQNNSVGTKFLFINMGQPPSGTANLLFIIKSLPTIPSPNLGLSSKFTIFGQYESAGTPPTRSFNGTQAALVTAGQDNDIEVYVKMNDVDVANGVVMVWVNGTLVYNASNWLFRITGETHNVTGVWLDWTFGGNNTTTRTRQDVIQLDDFYASGKI